MRVVCPYVTLPDAVRDALDATGCPWFPVNVSKSDSAYFELLRDLWGCQETFCVIEHDIVIRPDTLDILADCPNEWCSFGASYYVGNYHGLGCVKFGAGIMARNPLAMKLVGAMSDPSHPPMHWCRLDAWLQYDVLPRAGEKRCYHEPPVEHLSDGFPSHGCLKGAPIR